MKNFNFVRPCFIGMLCQLLPGLSFSQPFVDPVNVKMQYFPQESYIDQPQNSMGTNLYEISLLAPIEMENKDVILINPDFIQMNFTTDGESIANSNLYSLSCMAGIDHQWKNEKWRTMVLVIPKINSDFQDLSSDDYQIGGVVMATYKHKANLKYHFGFYYNKEFFGNYFLPIVGIDWKISNKVYLYGDMPSTMNLEYKLNKKLYATLSYLSLIGTYRLGAAYDNMYVREGDKKIGHDQLKICLTYHLMDHLVAFTEVGHTYKRTYQMYDNDNNEVNTHPVYNKTEDGIFYTLGVAYRFRLD